MTECVKTTQLGFTELVNTVKKNLQDYQPSKFHQSLAQTLI